jgi:Zn-dependent protease with chaperone function
MPKPYRTTAYRYPNELLILYLTSILVFLVIALTATATFCASVIFVLLAVGLAYFSSHTQHQRLMEQAFRITPKTSPNLIRIFRKCQSLLGANNVEVFVAKSPVLNAYTFGLDNPKSVVIYSALLNVMDEDEMSFILGHELGHVCLGHTRLNSLVGGMAGIPSTSSASALLTLAFLWWNRACEYSADRAGLLACGKPDKAISALIKLVAGPNALNPEGMERAYRMIDAQDDTILGNLSESFGTHPLLIRRIGQLRKYAQTSQYQRLQRILSQNTSS